jgi:rSAM/selenodomain-associated transferase 1
VIAKAPVAGRVKTRLCPPCTPDEAARIAAAALVDTLEAVRATPAAEPVVILDGPPTEATDGFAIVPQRGRGLDERLAAAFEDVGGPALLIGMDTPQVTPRLLADAIGRLTTPGVDAVLGPCQDGGWWAVGLRRPDAGVFLGVPMSTSSTADRQRDRLRSLGLGSSTLPRLRDVDRIEDALAVADAIPHSRFARTVRTIVARWPSGSPVVGAVP